MTEEIQTLLKRLRYCETHGIFTASLCGLGASYGEAADAIEGLQAALAIEARRAATLGAVHESAGPQDNAQEGK